MIAVHRNNALVRVVVATIVSLMCVAPNAVGQASCDIDALFPPSTYLTSSPDDLASADVDGDGRLDLIWIDGYPDTITAHLGTGIGTVTEAITSALPHPPTELRAVEMTGDGLMDFVVTSRGSKHVSIMIATGSGEFELRDDHPVAGCDHLAIGDLNGDGLTDIVVAEWFPSTYSVLLGSGDGTFMAPVVHDAITNPRSLAIADIDLDHVPDVLLISYLDDTLWIYHGVGDGTFDRITSYIFDHNTGQLQTGDYNGDGRTDVAVNSPDGFTILLNTERGALEFHSVEPITASEDLCAIDINGDGVDDLVATDHDYIAVWIATGNGSFTLRDAVQDLVVEPHVAFGDFNADGYLDLATADRILRHAGLLMGNGAGDFIEPPRYATAELPVAMLVNDFNGDGATDLITVHDEQLAYLQSDGAGGFLAAVFIPGGESTVAAVVVNANNDDRPDIVTVGGAPLSTLTLHMNAGGNFIAFEQQLSANIRSIAAADLDGDGDDDLILVDAENPQLQFLENDGSGEYTERSVLQIDDLARMVIARDINGDQLPDLLYNRFSGIAVSLADQAWQYAASTDHEFASTARFKLVDLNGDGLLDMLANDNFSYYYLIYWLGNGDGTFGDWDVIFYPATGARDFDAADLNDDGLVDVVMITRYTVGVAFGYGDGLFLTSHIYPIGVNPRFIATQDLDHDGRPDLILGGHNAVVTWTNQCNLCPADLTAPYGTVDAADLTLLFANWTEHGPGAELAVPLDVVDFADLLVLLHDWGPCVTVP